MEINPAELTTAQKAALVVRLRREATRRAAIEKWPNAHRMSIGLDSSLRRTQMLDMIAGAVQETVDKDRGRLLVSSPPQIGKSMTVAIFGAVRALVGNPDLRVVVASYSESLARRHVRAARDLVARYGSGAQDSLTRMPLPDRLGISLDDRKATETEWQVAGYQGGMYAVGVGGSLSGKPADLLIVDDPIKGLTEADSAIYKERLLDWWRSVALARLSPTASVVLVQTRWVEDDLAGVVLDEEGDRWRYINFPAVAEEGVPDALSRVPGTPLRTSRGHTVETWEETRRAVGPRVWAALYQGVPTPVGGGLFRAADLDRYRDATASDFRLRLVAVDPAETGQRDEAGVLALGLDREGRVAVTHDASGSMTSAEWSRRAVVLALRTKATELSFEGYTTATTYQRVLVDAWKDVEADLRLLRRHRGDVEAAARTLRDEDGDPLERLSSLDGLSPSDSDRPPFRIRAWRGKGDKVARASGARQASETGRLYLAGTFPALERQAITWQMGQSSPDRVDALVQGYERLREVMGRPAVISTPTRGPGGGSGLGSRLSASLDWS